MHHPISCVGCVVSRINQGDVFWYSRTVQTPCPDDTSIPQTVRLCSPDGPRPRNSAQRRLWDFKHCEIFIAFYTITWFISRQVLSFAILNSGYTCRISNSIKERLMSQYFFSSYHSKCRLNIDIYLKVAGQLAENRQMPSYGLVM